jgi:ribosomal protein S18 acetylase RimI-like enzyme
MTEVRAARPEDAPAIARLLRDLRSDLAPEAVGERIAMLMATGADPVFVACDGAHVRGVLALHLMHMLHLGRRIARITALSVSGDARRQGVGRRLVGHAATFAEREGCAMLELSTRLDRADAHAFYRSLAFEATSLLFRRRLMATAPADTAAASSRR